MDSSERKVIINENSTTDFTTNLEDKIIENTDSSSSLHVCIYSYLGFFDRESLKDYINDVLEDEEINIDNIESYPRMDDNTYIVASDEKLALIVKEWLEGYYHLYDAIIAESKEAIPPEEDPKIHVQPVAINPMDLTCESYKIIANFDIEDVEGEEANEISSFLSSHKVVTLDAYKEGEYVPSNIAVVIGNPSQHYYDIVDNLKKLNYSTTTLLLRFTIRTNIPELFKDAENYMNKYINLRYGSLGIESFVDIIDNGVDSKDQVSFEIDMKSNIPTTVAHSDIFAYIGSYCLAEEFAYNWSKDNK